jgi:hypothetical protein
MNKQLLLEFVKLIHVVIDFLICTYIFLIDSIYDIYYSGFVFLQTIHWAVLKNECIVTYIEKKLIDPNYVLGSDINWLPHYDTYYNETLKGLKSIIIVSTLAIITFRSKSMLAKSFSICAIILFIFLTYFKDCNDIEKR